MTAEHSALVVVLADDDAVSVQEKLLNSGARRVQLLVPDGVASLRDPIAARRLAAVAERSGIDLVLISSDPPTLRAARMGGLQLLQVDGAPVRAPGSIGDSAGAPTRVLERQRDLPPIAAELSAADAAFLDELDDLDAPPVREPGSFDADAIAVSGMLSRYQAPQAPPEDWRRPASNADADLAAALDSLDDLPPARPAPRRQTETSLRPAPPPVRPPAYDEPPPREHEQRRPSAQPIAAPRKRRNWLLPILSLVLILLLVAIGSVLVLSGIAGPRVTLVVSPPTPPELIEPVTDLPLPIVPPGSEPVDTAVAAAPITLDTVQASVNGDVLETTLEPAGFAEGVCAGA
ncbi:MAG: hypothetical protein HC822_19940 [Oscillochloris sp.]|nr:hypothetical protein [Oscillochloris sp.]